MQILHKSKSGLITIFLGKMQLLTCGFLLYLLFVACVAPNPLLLGQAFPPSEQEWLQSVPKLLRHLYSNRVTSEENAHPSPLSSIQSWGVCSFLQIHVTQIVHTVQLPHIIWESSGYSTDLPLSRMVHYISLIKSSFEHFCASV